MSQATIELRGVDKVFPSGVHDAIDTTLRLLRESGVPVTTIPDHAHEEVRATMLIAGLLMWGVAEPMAQA